MRKNNKGLSTVVTTLIIILLVLVATGIIWSVVSNLLGRSTGNIQTSTKCLDVGINAKKVNETGSGNYTVILERSSTGEDINFYAKVKLVHSDGNADLKDFGKGLKPLEQKSNTLTSTLVNATSIEVTPYFIDENSGEEKLCPTTSNFEFVSN